MDVCHTGRGVAKLRLSELLDLGLEVRRAVGGEDEPHKEEAVT